MVNWVKTVKMVDGDKKMTLKFHNTDFTENLDERGEF